MVIIKRYIGKMRKPLHWKGRKAFVRFAILPALVAVSLLLAVRLMVVTQYEMPYNRFDLDLLAGDRLVVNRLAYGWKTPLPQWFGAHWLGKRLPKRGDVVVFACPWEGNQVLVERVEALPGDTIELPGSAAPNLSTEAAPTRRYVITSEYCRLGAYVVPRACIIGRVFGITYSVNPEAPFYRCFRRERFLLKTDH